MGGPGIYSLLMNRVEEDGRGIASAVNGLTTSLSQSFASAIAGAAYVDFGYSRVFLATAGVAALAAVLFWLLLSEKHGIDPRDATILLEASDPNACD
jgi:predicted MFS family arabinose efflux permease